MIPLNKVKDLINKQNALEKELSSGDIDKKKLKSFYYLKMRLTQKMQLLK